MLYDRRQRRASKAPQEFVWPAPVMGLVRSGTKIGGDPRGCDLLENFIPTAEGARFRGGSVKQATIGGGVEALMMYQSGSASILFAADDSAIYDVTSPADPDVAVTAAVSGLTSGDWSSVQFATPGGQFLAAVNGADDYHLFNGSAWQALDGASSPAFTGVAGSTLSFVWSHKRRLWFVEQNTLSAWYLPVNSIAGAAVEFPLDGVFSLGGALLFGGTWSQDSGAGLDDLAVFVTTEGQIAVYEGTDPSNANSWSLVGVYRIGKPLGKNAWFRAGGDLVILTEDGIVPVSEALGKDRAALQAAAISSPIEDLWQEAIAARGFAFRFSVALWSTKTTLWIGVPAITGGVTVLVANTRTGAWATVTGWPATALIVFDDKLFYGTADGLVVRGDASGSDMGLPYSGRYVPNFQEMGASSDKTALHARCIFRAAEAASPRLVAFKNYQIGAFPVEAQAPATTASVWGAAVWGGGVWGGSVDRLSRTDWQAVAASGFSLSVGWIVGSNETAPPTLEIVGTILRYEQCRSI